MKCPNCGANYQPEQKFCAYCNSSLEDEHTSSSPNSNTIEHHHHYYTNSPEENVQTKYIYINQDISPKKKWVAFFLCFFTGFLGIHRFYLGKIGTGILYLFTNGLFGVGVIIDLIRIACGKQTDKYGYKVIE